MSAEAMFFTNIPYLPGVKQPEAVQDAVALRLWKKLTPVQRDALAAIRKAHFYRVTGGWKARGRSRMGLETANVLRRETLIRESYSYEHRGYESPYLKLTSLGERVLRAGGAIPASTPITANP